MFYFCFIYIRLLFIVIVVLFELNYINLFFILLDLFVFFFRWYIFCIIVVRLFFYLVFMLVFYFSE